ncbi:sensor histidine kinase [Paenibacillus soyae]|uniref:Sensor histidine kinase n=1 Tax=Paenibacillus soyae TaxID=2969249 RepID=A0A9X2MT28_9BACL|nr:sensor histidine kinase [Paenibacillus soyae]MCR2805960.1 sensor histidine kinase [Paenibacillus soyae]
MAFALFIIGPFLIVGWVSAYKTERSMQEELGRTMLQLAKQNHATIAKSMSAVNDKTITFLGNHLFNRTEFNTFWSNVETLGQMKRADEILERWSSDGTQYSLYMINKEDKRTLVDLSGKESGFKYIEDDASKMPAWSERALQKRGAGVFRLIASPAGVTSISFVRSVLNAQNYNDVLGFLVVSNLEVYLTRDLLNIQLPERSGIFLFNDVNELLMQAGSDELPEDSLSALANPEGSSYHFAGEGGERWLYALSYEPEYHTRLVYRVPLQSVSGGSKEFQWVIMALSAVYLVLVLLFVLYLLRIVVRPLHRLVAITKIYEPGVPLDAAHGRELLRSDEFGILYGAFLKMTRRLDRSFEENYLMKIEQKETELATLHSQITPHLLYNTLDSIYWYAVGKGNRDVGGMVKDLSRLLRIGLSKGKTMIPIGEEIEHASAYCRLQMKRYPDKFEVLYDIDEEAKKYATPKVILQPLIENAIFHAVSGMDGEGEIRIRIRCTDAEIEMAVEDNGFLPVDIGRLERITRGELADKGYGIRNVHQRVQLHFGEAFGLSYAPREGGGVIAKINLPRREYKNTH